MFGIPLLIFPEVPEIGPSVHVAVNVTGTPSQTAVEGEATKVTEGMVFTVTVWVAALETPQLVAVAVITIVPVQFGANVTCPVLALIEFPADKLAASRL